MAELRLYDVTLNGTTTQMQLTDEDAKTLYGDAATPAAEPAAAPAPDDYDTTKARAPQNKAAQPDGAK